MRPKSLILALCTAALVAAGCDDDGGAGAGTTGERSAEQATVASEGAGLPRVPEIYAQLEPSVVGVFADVPRGTAEGSGVAYRPDVVITNNHVVEGADAVRVALPTGERADAEVVATDPLTDLAVLRVPDAELAPAEFADALPRIGTLTVAIGSPLGFENSVTAGVVSGLDRSIPSGGRTPALVGLLQTDAAISTGNSGGALVGGDARVIGINVAYIPPQAGAVALGFAIPSPTVVDVVEELIADGDVDHAYLGVRLLPITPRVAEQRDGVESGAGIAAVKEDGPAGEAGIRPGDVIIAIGDREVRRIEDLYAALRDLAPGEQVPVTVVRDGERRSFGVTLGDRPEEVER